MSTTNYWVTGQATVPNCENCSTRARCLFAALPSSEHERFISHVRERTVAVGETLETQGANGQTLGVIKVGLLKGLRRAPGDEGKPIVLMGKGRLVGFTHVFGQTALLSLVTIAPARVCEVDVERVREMAMPHASFQHAIYKTIADFIGNIADWSRLLREDSNLIKVCTALHLIAAEEGSKAFRIPSHTELASVLGARRETVARHIAILIDKGLLKKTDRWHGTLIATDCNMLRRPPAEADGTSPLKNS